MKNFGKGMKAALGGLAAALGGLALGMGLGSAIEDAIKFEALMGTLSKTLGKSMTDFIKWQNTVGDAMGFSKLQVAEMGNNYSLRLKSIAKDEQDLLKKTTDLIKAAAVIRSRTGMSAIEISDRMRSAMNQEADGADELGVNVRVSSIQQSKAYKEMANNAPWEQLSEQMKKTILYYHILDSTTANFGTEIAQNTALLKGGFTSALSDAKLALGQAFLPILNLALPLLTKMARAAEVAFQNVAMFMRALFPKSNIKAGNAQVSAIDAQSGAVDGLGDSLDAAGKKAKKASNSLANFDEINGLGGGSKDDEKDDAAAVGATNSGGLSMSGEIEDETTKISSAVQAMANKVKKAFGEMTDFITEHKEIIIAALGGIATAFATLAVVKSVSLLLQGIGAAIAAILSPIGLLVLGIAALSGAFIYFYRNNEGFRDKVKAIWEEVKESLSAAWDWIVSAAKVAWDGLEKFWDKNGDAIKGTITATWEGIKTFLESTFNFIDTIAKEIWGGLKVFWGKWGDDITAIFNSIWQTVSKIFVDVFVFIKDTLGKLASFWNEYWPSLAEALINVWKILWFLLEPYVNALIKGIKGAFEALMPALETVWKDIKQVISGALDIIMGVVKIFIGIFTLDWDTFWGGIKQTVVGVWDSLSGILKLALDSMIGVVNVGAAALRGIIVGLWEGVRENTKEFQAGIATIVSNVWDGIVSTIKNSINSITGMINSFIDNFNKIKISIPSFTNPFTGNTVGGFDIGVPQIPKIPMLAQGGITGVNNPFLAMVGDNKTQREVVAPLDDLTSMISSAVEAAVSAAGRSSNNNGSGGVAQVNLSIDGTTFARLIAPFMDKETTRVGGAMIRTT
ncbi:phage tail protein [Paenibacillus allorhizoplanae]|nr:hypothetical protein [Paenibacillus allorhizoplanae]